MHASASVADASPCGRMYRCRRCRRRPQKHTVSLPLSQVSLLVGACACGRRRRHYSQINTRVSLPLPLTSPTGVCDRVACRRCSLIITHMSLHLPLTLALAGAYTCRCRRRHCSPTDTQEQRNLKDELATQIELFENQMKEVSYCL
jgi:hypothetical protein